MIATLTFTLPEERAEFQLACRGAAYRSVIGELDGEMRNAVKHGNESLKGKNALGATQYWRARLNELLRDAEEEG